MSSRRKTDTREVETQYAEYGMLGGAFIGMLAGLMYTGPHFREWSFVTVMAIIIAIIIAGGFLGYTILNIFTGLGLDDLSGGLSDDSGSDPGSTGHHTHTGGAAHHSDFGDMSGGGDF